MNAMVSNRSNPRARARRRTGSGQHSLRNFRMATLIYDATLAFCDRFVAQCSPTREQMLAAAHSGRQHMAQGSRGSTTSREEELQQMNEARASLAGLLLDYQDFLRNPGPGHVPDDQQEDMERKSRRRGPAAGNSTSLPCQTASGSWLEHATVVANAVIALIHQANELLDKHIAGLEHPCEADNGSCERFATAPGEEPGPAETDDQIDS